MQEDILKNRKIFLDINIIIDFIEPTRAKHKIVVEFFKYLTMNNYSICMSEDMLSTIFYIVEDKKSILKFFQTIQDRWTISPFGKDVVRNSIEISLENNLDLEDVLQCLCAKENGCEALITHDNQFYECGVPIYTVDEFLKMS